MSSRRKNKPVRRLNTEEVLVQKIQPIADDNGANELTFSEYDLQESKRKLETLPEGVYVLQPQSASDDEDHEVSFEPITGEQEYQTENNFLKKRAQNGNHVATDFYHGNGANGLNLSVKRRKTERDVSDNTAQSDRNDHLPSSEYQANIKRYLDTLLTNQRQFEQEEAENRDNLLNQSHIEESSPKDKDPVSISDPSFYSAFPPIAAAMVASLSGSKTNPKKSELLHRLFNKSTAGQASLQRSTPPRDQLATEVVDSITAGTVSSGVGSIKKGTLDPTNFDEEVFDKYITKYGVKNSCLQRSCPHITKDHYHCTDSDCNFQRFTNKGDVIRHYNMHKKRDNALAHGFMRFSPSDNCESQFGPCHLNGTSTHYHCLHSNCTKVYTSTSDVMTHENFHKKNSTLVTNGFKRYRATELCPNEACPFYTQRTTHFHCMRPDCTFTFKNKADMDKHKSYHLRDDTYTRQGFKKFYKNETCPFPGCSWNRTTNHFHCLRKNCEFSFVSTSQIVSHKRKHDRQDMNTGIVSSIAATPPPRKENGTFDPGVIQEAARKILESLSRNQISDPAQSSAACMETEPVNGPMHTAPLRESRRSSYSTTPSFYTGASNDEIKTNLLSQQEDQRLNQGENHEEPVQWSVQSEPGDVTSQEQKDEGQPLDLSGDSSQVDDATSLVQNAKNELPPAVLKYFRKFLPNECIFADCVFMDKHHFHCAVRGCYAVFSEEDFVLNHTSFHEKLDKHGIEQVITELNPSSSLPQFSAAPSSPPPPPGYITLSSIRSINPKVVCSDQMKPIKVMQEDLEKALKTPSSGVLKSFGNPLSSDAKREAVKTYINRIILDNAKTIENPTPTYKVKPGPKPLITFQPPPSSSDLRISTPFPTQTNSQNFIHFRAGTACMQSDCKYKMQNHWHCLLNRCRYVCKSLGKAQSHRQAHDTLEAYAKAAKDYFKCYSVKKMCPNPTCEFRLRGHYHCLKPGCQFVTIGTSKLPWHIKKHEKIAKREASGFKYYTKKDRCGKQGCKYSGLFSHYHCVRPGCSYAFQYKHQLSTHVRKHVRSQLDVSPVGDSVAPAVDETNHVGLEQEADTLQGGEVQSCTPTPAPLDEPLSFVIRSRDDLKSDGNEPPESAEDAESEADSISNEVLDLSHNVDGDMSSASSAGCGSNYPSNESNTSGSLETTTTTIAITTEATSNSQGVSDQVFKPKPCFSKFRLNSEVIDGFKRFDLSQDCGDKECTFAAKVSHYHCLHDGCHYRFTGRTHMIKHHQHHERVANIVRDDFKRVKSTQDCGFTGCKSSRISTHFHCLRCDFVCTDSSKVGTHRRKHVKSDSLEQSGFRKIRAKDDCGRLHCKYRKRNTSHYHCLHPNCFYTVIGLSGIEQHSNKHKNAANCVRSPSRLLQQPSTQVPPVIGASGASYTVPFAALSKPNSVTLDCASPSLNVSVMTSHAGFSNQKVELKTETAGLFDGQASSLP